MKRSFLIAIGTLGICACSPNPKLLRHYDTLKRTAIENPALKLSAFAVAPKSNPSANMISQLSERGQAEFIKSLLARMVPDAEPKDLLALLSEPYKAEERGCAWADKTNVTRRVAFTLSGDVVKPADRVDSVTVSLSLDPASKVNFVSWDRFDSAYASFNVGTASFKQSRKLTLNRDETNTRSLPMSGGSDVNLLKLGGEMSDELNESAAYSLRRLSLGGALSKHRAELIQEGGPNVNLFGTAVATLNLRLERQESFQQVFRLTLQKEKKPLAPGDVSVERCAAQFPAINSPIDADLTGWALFRAVQGNDGTISEGDDTITLSKLSIASTKVELIDSASLDAKLFGLVSCKRGEKLQDCDRVEIENAATDSEALQFESFANVSAFRGWLLGAAKNGKIIHLGGHRVGLSNLDGLALSQVQKTRVAMFWQQLEARIPTPAPPES